MCCFCLRNTQARLKKAQTTETEIDIWYLIDIWLNTVVGIVLYLVVNNYVRFYDIYEAMPASSTALLFAIIHQNTHSQYDDFKLLNSDWGNQDVLLTTPELEEVKVVVGQ